MSRYYYDCAIKAAYMAKYFGMEFEPPYDDKIDFSLLEVRDKGGKLFKSYLSQESLDLLKVQKGDIVDYGGVISWYSSPINPANDDLIDKNKLKPIFRNGRYFLWPEPAVITNHNGGSDAK